MKIATLACATALFVCAGCGTPVKSKSMLSQLEGAAQFECGPADGPATIMALNSIHAPRIHYIIHVSTRAPQGLKGRYEIGPCGGTTDTWCDGGKTGDLSVTSNTGKVLSGSLSMKAADGKTTVYPFTANIVPPAHDMLCG